MLKPTDMRLSALPNRSGTVLTAGFPALDRLVGSDRTLDAAAPRPKPVSRMNCNVHGARGLLALLVFVFHIGNSGVPSLAAQSLAAPHMILASMQFGVELFFCISGYIIVGTLGRATTASKFILDRLVRILPVLWATLLVIIPLGVLTHQQPFATLTGSDISWIAPLNFFPLAGVLPIPVLHMAAWSLSYEVLFYTIAVALWRLPAEQKILRAGVVALSVGLMVWHPRSVFFAVGVLVAKVDLDRVPFLRHATRFPVLMLSGFMLAWYGVQFTGGSHGDSSALAWATDGRLGLAAVAVSLAALAFSGIVSGHGVLGRVLRSRVFQFMGGLSYSFYLWHLIVLAAVKRVMSASHIGVFSGSSAQLLFLIACLPLSVLVSFVSMRLIEGTFTVWLQQQRHGLASRLGVLARGPQLQASRSA